MFTNTGSEEIMRGREPGASNVSFDREERGGGADRLQSKALALSGTATGAERSIGR